MWILRHVNSGLHFTKLISPVDIDIIPLMLDYDIVDEHVETLEGIPNELHKCENSHFRDFDHNGFQPQ